MRFHKLGEFPVIYGDEAVYFICNDNYASSPFGTPNMKIEIHGMAWGFNDPSTPSLYNTVFMRYEIYNLSGNAFNDIALGLWTDADIGDPSDDYLATDIGRNMIIFYNGDNFDGGAMGYGNNPPAQGVMMLNKTITSSVFYENTNGTYNGNPLVADDYYKYMTATLLNGAAMPTAFAFPVDTITISPPWNGGLQPADLRGVLSTDTIIFPANSVITLDAAYITALPDTPAGAWDAVVLLQQYADTIGLRYASGVLTSVEENIAQQKGVISIYPNPMNDVAQMSFNNMKDENGVLIITSIDGKIILEQAISTASPVMIKKSELAAGLYIVSARFKNQTLYSKLIIR